MSEDESRTEPRKMIPHHGHVLGNGGQAVRVGERLYPRDLHEVGLSEAPHIGTEALRTLVENLKTFELPKELPHSALLLAQKLTDIQKLSPSLDEFILATLMAYEWIAVEPHLAPTEDASNYAHSAKNAHSAGNAPADFVQIANRLRDKIYIHRPSWLELSPAGRTAILIHEAIYALLIPTETESGMYRQIGARARAITGLLFDPTVTAETPQLKLLLAHLGLPATSGRERTIHAALPLVAFIPYQASPAFEQLAVRAAV